MAKAKATLIRVRALRLDLCWSANRSPFYRHARRKRGLDPWREEGGRQPLGLRKSELAALDLAARLQ